MQLLPLDAVIDALISNHNPDSIHLVIFFALILLERRAPDMLGLIAVAIPTAQLIALVGWDIYFATTPGPSRLVLVMLTLDPAFFLPGPGVARAGPLLQSRSRCFELAMLSPFKKKSTFWKECGMIEALDVLSGGVILLLSRRSLIPEPASNTSSCKTLSAEGLEHPILSARQRKRRCNIL